MTLFVVSTPIGNLEDITCRALRILKEVHCIACEDTRRTHGLLQHYDIKKPLISFHAHSGPGRLRELIELLVQGRDVAVVTDSGTPGISDPGYLLVQQVVEQGIAVHSIPGPSAVTAACACAGIPCDRFVFLGFLPRKGSKAVRLLKESAALEQTVIFFESPFRVLKTVMVLKELFGPDMPVVIARELTKKFEEYIRGTVAHVLDELTKKSDIRGEFVVMFRTAVVRKGI